MTGFILPHCESATFVRPHFQTLPGLLDTMFKLLYMCLMPKISYKPSEPSVWLYNRHLVCVFFLCVPGNPPDHQWQSRHRGLCRGRGSSCGWPQLAGPGWPEKQSDTWVNMLMAHILFFFFFFLDQFTYISENEREAQQLAATSWAASGEAMLETNPLH